MKIRSYNLLFLFQQFCCGKAGQRFSWRDPPKNILVSGVIYNLIKDLFLWSSLKPSIVSANQTQIFHKEIEEEGIFE